MSPPVHLLLDYENVQPSAEDVAQVRGSHYRLWILHGSHQNHFPADLVRAWQPLGKQVRFVQSAKQGKNALDLHVAFCMGEAVGQSRELDQPGCFVIISGDKGFDALFGYLGQREIQVGRAGTIPDALAASSDFLKALPAQTPQVAAPTSPSLERVIAQLRAQSKQLPRTEKRLQNHIASLLGKIAADAEVRRVINELKSVGIVGVKGAGLHYRMPPAISAVKAAA